MKPRGMWKPLSKAKPQQFRIFRRQQQQPAALKQSTTPKQQLCLQRNLPPAVLMPAPAAAPRRLPSKAIIGRRRMLMKKMTRMRLNKRHCSSECDGKGRRRRPAGMERAQRSESFIAHWLLAVVVIDWLLVNRLVWQNIQPFNKLMKLSFRLNFVLKTGALCACVLKSLVVNLQIHRPIPSQHIYH